MDRNELFYRDPCRRAFDARVLSCTEEDGRWAVVLDDTAFYPEGGGQPADRGTLGAARVLDVQRRDGVILHYTDRPLPAGCAVHGELDWTRRFDHMQQHSGEHIVSGLIHRAFGLNNVGFHLGDVVTIDFDGVITWEDALAVERQANEVVWADRETVISWPSPEELARIDYRSKKALAGAVRLVEFPGADRCACCGTHVTRTGEIGAVKLLSLMRHRGGVRLTLLCGRRAMAYLDRLYDAAASAGEALSVKPADIAQAVAREQEQAADLRRRLAESQQRYFRLLAETLPEGLLAVRFEEGLSPWDLRKGAELLAAEGRARAVLLCSGGAGQYSYVLMSGRCDVRPLGKALNEALRGRGGGKDAVQGRYEASEEDIRRAAAALAPQYLS